MTKRQTASEKDVMSPRDALLAITYDSGVMSHIDMVSPRLSEVIRASIDAPQPTLQEAAETFKRIIRAECIACNGTGNGAWINDGYDASCGYYAECEFCGRLRVTIDRACRNL